MKTHLQTSILIGLLAFSAILPAQAQSYRFNQDEYKVSLENDTLTIENRAISRKWLWNRGNLVTCRIQDKLNGQDWPMKNKEADLFLPDGKMNSRSQGSIRAEIIGASMQHNPHLCVSIESEEGSLQIRKMIRLYPDCPAMACEIYLKGKASGKQMQEQIMEHVATGGKHWNIEAVEFFDRTDGINNLVRPVKGITYGYQTYKGNILFAENKEKKAGFFFIKQAPTAFVQLNYQDADFIVQHGQFSIIGLGLAPGDLSEERWTRAYGFVTGIWKGGEKERLLALRDYQIKVKPVFPDRDEMIMLNTWGDRGRDTRVNEVFCLRELELASKMGISHFQIDDGWQAGRSQNSAYGGSYKDIWHNPDYWTPDPVRFPHGLAPIVKRGKELGIEIGLWFNPSIQNDYEDWEKDAAALIRLYKEYGIRTFKIDGTFFENKTAENRLRMLYDRVMEATGWKAVLNLDVTAGKRGGYFYFNEYGNIFLENRYSDWGNYYPYWTLRNLWMLSRYVNPQILQIEFLNSWRNEKKYRDDPFAPQRYSFDYVFAITMAAQPLAWLEMANLPEEAYSTGKTIKKYRTVQHDLHSGYILPIGNEPSGESWCGFQSIKGKNGYLIVYRENNEQPACSMSTYFKNGEKIKFSVILGEGKDFSTQADENGKVSFRLKNKNSFCLYKYEVR